MNIALNGKTALVIGGASPVASAICASLANSGASVWQQLFVKEPGETSQLATSIVADVRDEKEMKKVAEALLQKQKKIDFLINAFPVEQPGSLQDLTAEKWMDLFEYHVDVPFISCKEVLPIMVQQGSGVVVNISSSAAVTGEGGPHFAAAKSALNSMTRGLAREYKKKGIRVNGVAPSFFKKDEQENQEAAASTAAMVTFLCSEYGKHFSGETIMIDGGKSVG